MREKGWNIVGRVKNPVPPLKPGRIGAGSRVTFVDRFGKNRTGTAVMLGPHGWVLNMGGRHGTPHVVRPDTIVKVVNPRRKANPRKTGTRKDESDSTWGVPRTMKMRKIDEVSDGEYTVKVYWDPEYSEFVNRLFVHGKENKAASHHTNDKDDAISTARAMLGTPAGRPRAALMRRAKNPSETRNWEYLEKYYAQVVPAAERLHIPVKKIERLVHAGERTSLATLKKTLARMIEGARKQGSPWTAQAARMANSVLVNYFAIEHGTRLVRKERVTKKRRAN